MFAGVTSQLTKDNNGTSDSGFCHSCRHLLLDHSRSGKGKCMSGDSWGRCNCPKFMTEQEAEVFYG